jgi:K+-transporting ATPase KdpF subunit
VPAVCGRLRSPERKTPMITNGVLLIISALLMVYLVYALLRPEKF